MKLIDTQNAVGCILCHDITQIIKDVSKGAVFRKGHIITNEDISVLLSVGKEHIYVWEQDENMLHEDEAAELLCKMSKNENMISTEPKEGKIELKSAIDGLFKVDTERLFAVNSFGEMMIATIYGNTKVSKGDRLAGMRVIPLVISKDKMYKAMDLCGDTPILSLLPFQHKRAAIITTGSEVQKGRIKDTFTPVIKDKLAAYDIEIAAQKIVGDNPEDITALIIKAIEECNADFVICTGGMSVDPDDRTPLAIRNTGAEIVSYGAPVLPGAMFMLAYYNGNIPIVGLPGCVMYAGKTVFDIVLPRIMANDRISAEELAMLGHGGLI